ncbi:glycosyltransferase [Citrobacter braakii]|uniref:glycosyltransferase n=1 Tax=Citrobacter braakii TaxID=57706 RepID=UPI0020CFAF25|nr:glycosyltransferase [Citrobacter braakii]
MPCFNSGKTVIKSVQSVLNQSYQNFELIICDDNSTDNTIANSTPKCNTRQIKQPVVVHQTRSAVA